MSARLRRFLLLAGMLSISALAAPVSSASAACDTSWTGADAGNAGKWEAPGNWTGGIPDNTKVTCADLSGQTITVADFDTTKQLIVGTGVTINIQGFTDVGNSPHNARLNVGQDGSIASGASIHLVPGGGSNPGSSSLVNAGDPAHPLVNNGLLQADSPNTGLLHTDLSLVNNSGGTVAVNGNMDEENSGDWTNHGQINVGGGAQLYLHGPGAGPVIHQSDGAWQNNGRILLQDGTWHTGTGSMGPGAVDICSGHLFADGSGTATFNLINDTSIGCNGNSVEGGSIHQNVTVNVNNTTAIQENFNVANLQFANLGHLNLMGTGDIVLVQGQGGTFSNTGTVSVSGTGKREIDANVVNGSGGLFDLVHRSADFNGHNFTQQAGATLGLDVDADQTSKLTVAAAQLDGTLAVRTSTPTATGHQRILDATTRTGTFAATTFSGPAWTVGYDATGAFLDPAAGGGGGGGGDTTPPAEKLSGSKSQKLGKTITVTVTCDEDCTATGRGAMRVPKLAKVYKLKKTTKPVAAGRKVKLRLKVPKKARKAAKRALKRHKRVKAKLTVVAKDASGNKATKHRTIKLKLK